MKQPWAWLICAGLKDVENRNWRTKFRGRIYVHASKATDEFLSGNLIIERLDEEQLQRYRAARMDRGAIIGEVTITDCKFRHGDMNENLFSKWHFVGNYGYYLKDPVLYDDPIPCRGMLGLFEPDIERG